MTTGTFRNSGTRSCGAGPRISAARQRCTLHPSSVYGAAPAPTARAREPSRARPSPRGQSESGRPHSVVGRRHADGGGRGREAAGVLAHAQGEQGGPELPAPPRSGRTSSQSASSAWRACRRAPSSRGSSSPWPPSTATGTGSGCPGSRTYRHARAAVRGAGGSEGRFGGAAHSTWSARVKFST
jgi:hypothetical protein